MPKPQVGDRWAEKPCFVRIPTPRRIACVEVQRRWFTLPRVESGVSCARATACSLRHSVAPRPDCERASSTLNSLSAASPRVSPSSPCSDPGQDDLPQAPGKDEADRRRVDPPIALQVKTPEKRHQRRPGRLSPVAPGLPGWLQSPSRTGRAVLFRTSTDRRTRSFFPRPRRVEHGSWVDQLLP